MRRRRRPALVLALSLAISFALHGALLPLLAWWWTPPVAARPEPETITYLDLTPEKPPEAPKPPEVDEERPRPPKPELPKPELELEELPEPEEEPEPEPEEEPEPPPPEEKPEIEIVYENLKMVEQPDELDEEEAPEDVNYLSNVNRDVEQETRAEVTNLVEDAVTPQAQQLEASTEPETGTASEERIAQTQQVESQADRKAPQTRPEAENRRPNQSDPKPESLLAMREVEHRDHKLPQEAHEALADESPEGILRGAQEEQASLAPQERQARIDLNDPRYAFKLAQKDMEAFFGKDPNAPRRAESLEQSKTKGVWENARARYQSPLENMVPEVQVGNQTALRSRKHPFARYIAQMHRKIHEAWAWGFLEQLDGRGRNHPLNDYGLWTRVEIVLDQHGVVEKVITVRHSGKSSFDAAAREIVHASGPYPDPPREILSGNGKIYIHWAFHRDNQACGTFGAQPFILDDVGNGDRPDPNIRVRAGRGGEELSRRLAPRGHRAPSVPEGPALPPGSPAGPPAPTEQEHEGHEHDHEHPSPAPESGASSGGGGGAGSNAEALAAEPGASKAANAWLHALAQGDLPKLAARSSLPFYVGEAPIARTREELEDVLQAMIDESRGNRPRAAKVFSAAGLRQTFGSVPAGVQEGSTRVYAYTRIGGDGFILLLEKKFGAWRVVGTTR